MNKLVAITALVYCFMFTTGSKVFHGNITLSVDNFEKVSHILDPFEVIEGALTIQLIHFKKDFSLPNLQMITDYLIIHRINGIHSLADFLPNLRVIRGRKLFHEFAFTAVSNDKLQQIGKWNLEILNGAVAFVDNIMLCPGGLNLWQRKTNELYWKTNRFVNNHPDCFEDCLADAGDFKSQCSEDENCSPKDKGCHEECVAGCHKPHTPTGCIHCRHFDQNGICYENCSDTHLQYMDYKCITKQFCLDELKEFIYKAQDESVTHCVSQCPRGYEANAFKICVKQTEGSACTTSIITSANMGKSLKDCTVINGNLRIALYERADASKIRKNTENIGTVTGYVEVVGASLLYSLSNILPHLQQIKGEETVEHGERSYALYVTDNINLRELWNFENKIEKLKISGNAYVGFNIMLCPSQVDQLAQFVLENFTVYKGANGKEAQCIINTTNLEVLPGSTEGTLHLYFEHMYEGIDGRWFLGYYIYYKESETNITSVYEGRDPYFDERVWTRIILMFTDVPNEERYIYTIKDLKVNTTYAFYLESFGMGQETRAIQSKVVYASTLEKNPNENFIGRNKLFENNNTLSVVVESTEPKVFYEFTVGFQFYEDVWNLTEEKLCSLDKERTVPPPIPALDDFTDIPDMKKISCDGSIDIQKIYNYKQRQIQVSNAILNSIIYDSGDVGDRNFLPLDTELKFVPRVYKRTEESIYVNWTNNDISFSPIAQDQKWTNNETSWHMTKFTNENSIHLELPADYINNEGLDIEFSVRVCRNRIENCSDYLKNESPCAQCSPALSWREDYNANGHFNVTAQMYFVNETEQLTRDIDHPCANQIGGHQTLEIVWQEDRMAQGYNISITGDSFQKETINIWTNQITATELNYTCYLPINFTNVYITVYSRRRSRSLSIGITSILNSTNASDDDILEVALWSCVPVFLILAIGILWTLKSRNENKKTVYNVNPNYSIIGPREQNHLRSNSSSTQTALWKEVQEFLIKDITISSKSIGNGNFGSVYKGYYTDGREVAVKIFLMPSGTSLTNSKAIDEANYKALEEMKICRSLDNDLIVKCYGMIINDCKFCQVFPYIPGGNLEVYLQRSHFISEDEKKRFAVQAARALEYLAEEKVVHLDIALRNFLKNEERLKLCDFGLAARWTEECKHKVSEQQPVCSAPERAKSELYLNTDIWSYGILLYTIYNRESLFKGVDSKLVWNIIKSLFNDEGNPSKRIVYANTPFSRIDDMPEGPIKTIISACIKRHADRPFAPWIIDRLISDENHGQGSCWNVIEDIETNKEIEMVLQNGKNDSAESLQVSFFVDDEEAPCLTPESDGMSGGTSCISLQCISRKHRFNERMQMGASLPI